MNCHAPLQEKWIVIPVLTAPKSVSDIMWKLPANVQKVCGVVCTISKNTADFEQKIIGELSLLTNNRLSQPLSFAVSYKPKLRRLDKELLSLSEPIAKGTRIEGYYRNLSDVQYELKLYVKCLITAI